MHSTVIHHLITGAYYYVQSTLSPYNIIWLYTNSAVDRAYTQPMWRSVFLYNIVHDEWLLCKGMQIV